MKKVLFLILIISFLLVSCKGQSNVERSGPPDSTVYVSSTPEPPPLEPTDFSINVFELNNDFKHLTIKVEYIDPFTFSEDSLERTFCNDIYKEMEDMIDWIEQAAEEYPASKENPISYGLTSFLNITENDNKFLSAYVDYYMYTGGAHGNLSRNPYVYDRNGNKYDNLEKILASGITFSDIEKEVNIQMKKNVEENGPMYYEDTVSFEDLHTPPYFYIRHNNIVVYFQTYEIAPYASGIQEFSMPEDFMTHID